MADQITLTRDQIADLAARIYHHALLLPRTSERNDVKMASYVLWEMINNETAGPVVIRKDAA